MSIKTWRRKGTSTVGLPRLSKIWRALTLAIVAMAEEGQMECGDDRQGIREAPDGRWLSRHLEVRTRSTVQNRPAPSSHVEAVEKSPRCPAPNRSNTKRGAPRVRWWVDSQKPGQSLM